MNCLDSALFHLTAKYNLLYQLHKTSTVIYSESKNKTPNFCPHLRQILTDFQNSFTDTLSRSHHIKNVAALHFEIIVLKNCTNRKHNNGRPGAGTHRRECDRGRWAATKATRPATNSSFNTPNSKICCGTDHFFTAIMVWTLKCFKIHLLEKWLEESAMRDSTAQKQLLNDDRSVIKRYSH